MKQSHCKNRRKHGRLKRAKHRLRYPGRGPYASYGRLDPFPTSNREGTIANLISQFKFDPRAMANLIASMMTRSRGKARSGS